MLSPVPGGEQGAVRAFVSDDLRPCGEPAGHRRAVRTGRAPSSATSGSHSRRRGASSSRSRTRRRGRWSSAFAPATGQRPGQPVVRQQTPRPCGRRCRGSFSAIHRSLVTVKRCCTALYADGVGTGLRTAQMLDHLADLRRGPQVVPQQRRSDHVSGLVEGDHAVLLPADSDRGGAPQQLTACWSASRHTCGWTSVPGGCGAEAESTTVPSSARISRTLVDCVDESIPATSVTVLPGRVGRFRTELAGGSIRIKRTR